MSTYPLRTAEPTRKVERDMLAAVRARRDWAGGSTVVSYCPDPDPHLAHPQDKALVYLHGHLIAVYFYGSNEVDPLRPTFRDWPTNTTASRLRALGVPAHRCRGRPCIDGETI